MRITMTDDEPVCELPPTTTHFADAYYDGIVNQLRSLGYVDGNEAVESMTLNITANEPVTVESLEKMNVP